MKRAEPEVCLAEPPTKRQRAIDAINALAQEHTRTCVATAVAYQLIKEIILRIIARPVETPSFDAPAFGAHSSAAPSFDAFPTSPMTSGFAPCFGTPSAAMNSPCFAFSPNTRAFMSQKPVLRIDYIMIIKELVNTPWFEQFASLKEIVQSQCVKLDDNYLTLAKRINTQDFALSMDMEAFHMLRAICFCVINGAQSFLAMHGDDTNQAIEAAVNFIAEHHSRNQAEIMSTPIKQAGAPQNTQARD